jgi:hypothetical protein
VDVRVVRERRTPGVQHQGGADLRTQVPGIGGNGAQRLGCHLEQQAVDDSLVPVRDLADGRGQREDHVEVVHRQQVGLARIQPALCSTGLALGAVAVAARVVGDLQALAVFTAQHMSPQCRAAALLDGCHDLELTQTQVGALGLPPGRPVGAEDVRHLQGSGAHGEPTRC